MNLIKSLQGDYDTIVMDVPKTFRRDTNSVEAARGLSNRGEFIASTLLYKKRDYVLFNPVESDKKIKVLTRDIILVSAYTPDTRHQEVVLKRGEKYLLLYCPLDKLIELSSRLVQVNVHQLVSMDIVNEVHNDLITLKGMTENKPAYITLERAFRNEFKDRLLHR